RRVSRKFAPGPFAKVPRRSKQPAKFTATLRKASFAPKLFAAKIYSPPEALAPQRKKPRFVLKGKSTSCKREMLFFFAIAANPNSIYLDSWSTNSHFASRLRLCSAWWLQAETFWVDTSL